MTVQTHLCKTSEIFRDFSAELQPRPVRFRFNLSLESSVLTAPEDGGERGGLDARHMPDGLTPKANLFLPQARTSMSTSCGAVDTPFSSLYSMRLGFGSALNKQIKLRTVKAGATHTPYIR